MGRLIDLRDGSGDGGAGAVAARSHNPPPLIETTKPTSVVTMATTVNMASMATDSARHETLLGANAGKLGRPDAYKVSVAEGERCDGQWFQG